MVKPHWDLLIDKGSLEMSFGQRRQKLAAATMSAQIQVLAMRVRNARVSDCGCTRHLIFCVIMLSEMLHTSHMNSDCIMCASLFSHSPNSHVLCVQEYSFLNSQSKAAVKGLLLQLEPKIWQQYPMICPVTAKIGLGLPAKVAIHRGFLRAGAGHHHIVEPEFAKSYFGKHCMPPECETMMEK